VGADATPTAPRLASLLTQEIHELDQRIAVSSSMGSIQRKSMTSVPSVGAVNAAKILARLGDPNRFRSLAGARSFSGPVPSLDASRANGRHGPPTTSGDAPLRQALFTAANSARRSDPTLAARYHRPHGPGGQTPQLGSVSRQHRPARSNHRLLAARRALLIRDVDGTALLPNEARRVVLERYRVSEDVRAKRRTGGKGMSRRSKESPSAPSTGPSRPEVPASIT
jgi:hypothetical protein